MPWLDRFRREESVRIPLPPASLRERVGGEYDRDPRNHLVVGANISFDIERLLQKAGRPLRAFRSVLDFGCGCGRVLRWMPRTEGCRWAGADIDSEAIGWCKRSMTDQARFVLSPALPPAPFDDASFDLIYAVSVFSHLPEDMELAWIAELARLLSPAGVLVASVLSENDFPAAGQASDRDQFAATGFCYLRTGGTPGLPDFYHVSFHKPSYVGRRWSEHFNILDYEPRGVNHHQDAFVCEKR